MLRLPLYRAPVSSMCQTQSSAGSLLSHPGFRCALKYFKHRIFMFRFLSHMVRCSRGLCWVSCGRMWGLQLEALCAHYQCESSDLTILDADEEVERGRDAAASV